MENNFSNLFDFPYIKDLLSVIILTYNQGNYLFDAINSVLEQDYPFIELIVSDDGSANFDMERVEDYINQHKGNNILKIRVLHLDQNIGTVRNINNALSISKGEFVKILGGDDTYPIPDVFSKQVQAIKSGDYLVSIGKSQQCDEHMSPIQDSRVERSNFDLPKVLKMDYISARRYILKRDIFPIVIQAICYHRDFFLRNGVCDEDYILIDDAPSALKILKESTYVTYLDFFSVNHRSRVGISTSRELFAPKRLKYYQDCITYCKKEICTLPKVYNPLFRFEMLRVNEYVYKMARSKDDNKSIVSRLITSLCYIDAIIYYVIRNSKKVLRRLVYRFKGK